MNKSRVVQFVAFSIILGTVIALSCNSCLLFTHKNDTKRFLARTSATPPTAPLSLTATPGNAQVVLNWATPASDGGSPITGYNVYQGIASGSESLLATLGVTLTYPSTGLTNGVTYYFQVSAVNSIGEGSRSTEVSATPVTVPNSPQSFTATAENAQVLLNWNAPASNGGAAITNYNVYQGTSTNGETLLTTLGITLVYTATSLTNGQTYFFKVCAVNMVGAGANSTEASATPVTVPGQPQSLTATGQDLQVMLNWTAPVFNGGASITSYKIYVGTTVGGESLNHTVSGSTLSYIVTNLHDGQTYYFQVSAVNGVGEGTRTIEVNAIPGGVPSAPLSFTATPQNGQIQLNWVTPVNDGGFAITGYRIYRSMTSGSETFLINPGITLTYLNSGLTNGQVYYYKVQAVNSIGNGANSTEVSATPRTVPGAPTLNTATPGNTNVTLAWSAPASNGGSPITSYNLYRSMTSGTEVLVQSGVTSPYTNTGLTNGQIYYFEVTAVNAAGEGARSNELSATPRTVPGAATLNSVTPSNAQITLAWTAPASDGGSAITGYNIYVGKVSNGEVLNVSAGVVLTYNSFTGLKNGVSYFFKVAARNAAGVGTQSNELSATPRTVPGAPTLTTLTPGNTQVIVAWTAGNNGGSPITSYNLYRSTTSGGETLLVSGVTSPYPNTGLTNGQVYYYKVSAVNVVGEGVLSAEASTTPRTVPGAPLSLTATAGNVQVVLTWAAPASNGGAAITGYKVYEGTTSGGETLLTTLGAVLTYTSTSLAIDQVYYFKVSAVNSAGEGARSVEANAMPIAVAPATPENVQVTNGDGQVVLSWQAPANNGGSAIIEYKIYRGTSPTSKTLYATVSGAATTYTDTGVTNGQAYYYTITAINEAGESNPVTDLQASPSMATYKIALIIVACVVPGVAIIAIAPKMIKRNKARRLEREERERELEEQQQAEAARQRRLELERQQQAEATRQRQLELERQQQEEAARQWQLQLELQRQSFNQYISKGKELALLNNWEGTISAYTQALGIAHASYLKEEEIMASEAIAGAKRSWATDLEARSQDISSLIEQGDYDAALASLATIKDEALRGDLRIIVERVEERIASTNMFKQLARILKAATRLKIDDVCQVLKRPRNEMFDTFIEWSEKFGFKIDGDYLVVGATTNLGGALADLDKAFTTWTAQEKTKHGKI